MMRRILNGALTPFLLASLMWLGSQTPAPAQIDPVARGLAAGLSSRPLNIIDPVGNVQGVKTSTLAVSGRSYRVVPFRAAGFLQSGTGGCNFSSNGTFEYTLNGFGSGLFCSVAAQPGTGAFSNTVTLQFRIQGQTFGLGLDPNFQITQGANPISVSIDNVAYPVKWQAPLDPANQTLQNASQYIAAVSQIIATGLGEGPHDVSITMVSGTAAGAAWGLLHYLVDADDGTPAYPRGVELWNAVPVSLPTPGGSTKYGPTAEAGIAGLWFSNTNTTATTICIVINSNSSICNSVAAGGLWNFDPHGVLYGISFQVTASQTGTIMQIEGAL